MLVFSRKKDEAITIGSEIEIKVISVGRDTVKLGISAPREIPIHRKEIYLAIEEENRKAATKLDAAGLDMIKSLIKGKTK
jgi:carbon storage regulator